MGAFSWYRQSDPLDWRWLCPGPCRPKIPMSPRTWQDGPLRLITLTISRKTSEMWILGGDLNSTTSNFQPPCGPLDPLDFFALDSVAPARTSMDQRPVSSHGKRFLRCLTDAVVILNGLTELGCSDGFTRLPQRQADCPGVIDYISCSFSALRRLHYGAMSIIKTPADMSDHQGLALQCDFEVELEGPSMDATTNFSLERLPALSTPASREEWELVDNQLRSSMAFQKVHEDLRIAVSRNHPLHESTQNIIDTLTCDLEASISQVFKEHRLLRKRTFGGASIRKDDGSRVAAPPLLRAARQEARRSNHEYISAVRTSSSIECIAKAKSSWNAATRKCRKLSGEARAGFCLNWRALWTKLKTSSPQRL